MIVNPLFLFHLKKRKIFFDFVTESKKLSPLSPLSPLFFYLNKVIKLFKMINGKKIYKKYKIKNIEKG